MDVTPDTLAELEARQDQIIRRTAERVAATTAGADGRQAVAADTVTAGMRFTTQMLSSAMALQEPAILQDQLSWAQKRLPHDGVSARMLLANLRIYAEVVHEILAPQSAREVGAYVGWMIDHLDRHLDEEGDSDE